MTTAFLTAIALAFQIILLSIWFPRRLVNAARNSSCGQLQQTGSRRADFSGYLALNYAIATLGLACLLLCTALYFSRILVVTGLLLAIGVVFLAQMMPLATLFYRGTLPVEQDLNRHRSNIESAATVPRLFDVLPSVPAVIAVGLYIAYVVTIGALWIRTGTNQAPKLVSITFTNLVCAGAILWTYRRLLRETDEVFDRYKELVRMGPLLVFASILVSVYFFAKEVLFALDLQEARPIMMSFALQVVAAAIFYTVSGLSLNRTMPHSGAGDKEY